MSTTHCVHRWAHNTDPDRSGKTGNMSFNGMALYSYNTIIAVKYPKKNIVLMADHGIYNSSTTIGHKGRVWRALPREWKVIYVDVLDRYGTDLLKLEHVRKCHDGMRGHLDELLLKVASSRRGASQLCRLNEYDHYRLKFNALSTFLGRKTVDKISLDENTLAEIARFKEKRDASLERRRKEALRQNAIREEERRKKESENAEKWRRREFQDGWCLCGTYLRLSKTGDFVETSRGVVVKIEDALKLYNLCQAVKERNLAMAWTPPSDISVGDWRLNHVNPTGDAVVGCHHLRFEEMTRCFQEAVEKGYVK